jgi:glycerophosphoryl diester phosphodiesterase
MKNITFILLTILFFSESCEMEVLIPVIPTDRIEKEIKGTKDLSVIQKQLINGLYLIKEGNSDFGDTAVVKWYGSSLSIFVKKEESYIILQGGEKNNQIIFAGYWRYSLSEELGYIDLKIDDISSKKILNGQSTNEISISGNYYINQGTKNLTLQYLSELKEDNYYIIAHRGGGRNIDRLPYSENSVEIIEFAEKLGANAIEIDVQLTKDKVPVLFHDKNLSKRLVNEDYFIGKVSDYDHKILKKFVTLKNGEKIPTLDEALKAALYNTSLKAVWLDVKSVESVEAIIQIIISYEEKAKQIGKKFEIFLGIPDKNILNAFMNYPNKENVIGLCELDLSSLEKSNSKIWAPRWTLGLQTDQIEELHARGIKVFTWTLDEFTFIKKYIKKGKFDGILTNYPFLVAYEYYTN